MVLLSLKYRSLLFLSVKRATGRLITAAIVGSATVALLTPSTIAWWIRAVAGWDLGALVLSGLAWAIIYRADAHETRRRAAADDPGRSAVFGIALGSSLFSLFAATVILHKVKGLPDDGTRLEWTLLTLAAVPLSWILTHTAYTLRYAHLHYRRGAEGGLEFPGSDAPADIDFAYFAFTIGMCFQVSDVVVTSTRLRRAALFHALLSFVYNTTILALALNLVFGLMA